MYEVEYLKTQQQHQPIHPPKILQSASITVVRLFSLSTTIGHSMTSLSIDSNRVKILQSRSASITVAKVISFLFLVILLLLQFPFSSSALAAAASRRRNRHQSSRPPNNFSRVKNQWKRNSGGILDFERSILGKRDDDGSSASIEYILGSDEAGRGCIAGPVVAATCCILPLRNEYDIVEEGSQDQHTILNLERRLESLLQCIDNDHEEIERSSNLIRDSKQLSPSEREHIFDVIVANPQMFAYSVAQRSNVDIDERQNILLVTMDCFQESIEELACEKLPHGCRYSRVDRSSSEESTIVEPPHFCSNAYSIVDGKKTPKLSLSPMLPCRPYVNADAEILTVSLASIIAKVTRDRLAESWHDQFPQYGFMKHKGYATKDHIEAIHKHGPCPLHRMTFKSLKGR